MSKRVSLCRREDCPPCEAIRAAFEFTGRRQRVVVGRRDEKGALRMRAKGRSR